MASKVTEMELACDQGWQGLQGNYDANLYTSPMFSDRGASSSFYEPLFQDLDHSHSLSSFVLSASEEDFAFGNGLYYQDKSFTDLYNTISDEQPDQEMIEPNDDIIRDISVLNWYKNKSREEKAIVISYMSRYWYGSDERRFRKMTCKTISRKFTNAEFETVLHCNGDQIVLARITEIIKSRFGPRNRPLWTSKKKSSDGLAIQEECLRQDPPAWLKLISKTDKTLVTKIMCQRWFKSCERKDRALARYRIRRYFKPEDFQTVLHSELIENADAVLEEIGARTAKGLTVGDASTYLLEQPEANLLYNQETKTSWYQALKRPEDKTYVITRMSYMWYHDPYEPSYREKSRRNIIKQFSKEDFDLVADANTPADILIEISNRTRPNEKSSFDIELTDLKNKILKEGVIKERTLHRYIKEALKKLGYDQRPIADLKDHIYRKWEKCAPYRTQ